MARSVGAVRRGATCLKRSPCKAGMFRTKSKDHEGDPCKGHDITASGMTERLGATVKLVAVNGGRENSHTLIAESDKKLDRKRFVPYSAL